MVGVSFSLQSNQEIQVSNQRADLNLEGTFHKGNESNKTIQLIVRLTAVEGLFPLFTWVSLTFELRVKKLEGNSYPPVSCKKRSC